MESGTPLASGNKDRLRRSVSAEWPSPECGTVWELDVESVDT